MSLSHRFQQSLLAVLLVLSPLAQAAETAAPAAASKPVAVVNGQSIPALWGTLTREDLLHQGAPNSPQLDEQVKQSLINLVLLSDAAVKEGLDKNATIAAALDIGRRDTLAKAYLQNYVKTHPIGDAQIKQAYEQAKAANAGDEYKVRHILVKTKAEADAIIAQLEKGASFAKLAKEKSMDPGSAKNGGELGWVMPANLVPQFSEAMAKLQKGQYTKSPVETQFGWHIIDLQDKRPVKVPPLAEVKEQIVQQLQQQELRQAIQALRQKATIQ